MADQLARKLKYQRMYDDAIHGDKNQDERDRVLANFKSNRVNIFFSFFFFNS
jgi:superfamily II DNA/RNA helicase